MAAQFAHMHNIRVSLLDNRFQSGPGDLQGFPRGAQQDKLTLQTALEASGNAITEFLAKAQQTGNVKGWKGPPSTVLGYLFPHEAHHRGQ